VSHLKPANYYEFLQISPNAEPATIHRVFQFLAVRLHPDNPESGNAEQFILLKQAYDVLSDPVLRAEYDAACEKDVREVEPISATVDFMDNMDGELNRRSAVLALLYIRRRNFPDAPEVSLFEIETRMGFPRDYLQFTIWYLHKKGYIQRADNAEFTLTADGVDFVETQRVSVSVLNKLLTSGSTPTPPEPPSPVETRQPDRNVQPFPKPATPPTDRRARGDRRKRA
jgi:curved DNA-binding protein CbpA